MREIYRAAGGRKGYKMEGEQGWRDRIERDKKNTLGGSGGDGRQGITSLVMEEEERLKVA